jgi:hypothetical protein
MNIIVIVSTMAAGLALRLARETRLRRAFEALCTRHMMRPRHRARRDRDRAARRHHRTLVVVAACLVAAASVEARAGWFNWLWSDARHHDLEQSLRVATQTAEAASRAVESQSRQATSQAEQNSRVAVLLEELSQERQRLTTHVAQLAEAGRPDSLYAAAVLSAAPALVSGTSLLLASVALWALTRPGASDPDVASALLRLATKRTGAGSRGAQTAIGRMSSPRRRIRDSRTLERLAEPVPHDDADPPF